jgi:hypothetical protein
MNEEEQQNTLTEVNAVIVIRRDTPDGGVETDVFLNGDVKATEAQTILELGLSAWRKKIGL